MDQLRDIRGLDVSVYWWSLTDVLIAFALLLVLLFIIWLWLSIPTGQTWKTDAKSQLLRLRRQFNRHPSQVLMGKFSILLRRIAMARCGRSACAGLEGEAWLLWLQQNDPKGFQWSKYRKLLLDLPYAPPNEHLEIDRKAWRALFKASLAWVEIDPYKQPNILSLLRWFRKKQHV